MQAPDQIDTTSAASTPAPAPRKRGLRNLIRSIRGANEYVQSAVLVFLIALFAVAAVTELGTAISEKFKEAGTEVKALKGGAAQ